MTISKFNGEGYKDPTSYEALSKVVRDSEDYSYLPLVYICSPYAGEVEINVIKAKKFSRFAVNKRCIPVTPHLLYPQFMDDNNLSERNLARHINYVLLGKCEELWVFGSVVSSGMEHEIGVAKKRNMKIKYFSEELQEVAKP